jgi:hypothetical protein
MAEGRREGNQNTPVKEAGLSSWLSSKGAVDLIYLVAVDSFL